MTEKRFILIDGVKKGTHSGIWDNLKQNNQRVGDELWVGEVVAMLNEGIAIVEENEQLKQDLKIIVEHRKQENEYTARLEEKNEQLQQRNDRQAKQLDRLYSLVEEKNWRALSDILDDFERCEEQLQKEWGYGDYE